jgi:hypothetical protein
MSLSKAQQTIWQRARAMGAGGQATGLDDQQCIFLIARTAKDLGIIGSFPELVEAAPDFFESQDLRKLRVDATVPAAALFLRLVQLLPDADTYFACLATLHKARLKFQTILETQPIPTMEQVGPRGLLQYGTLSSRSLGALLFWRKWFFDIDNRSGQETGYVFEPVIAHAVGGTPIPAKLSPVKRSRDDGKGRQIDCLIDKFAYEIKLRVTIAASGQGRWSEELDFPADCKNSGYTPVLVVLDGTHNPKLKELAAAFSSHGGKAFIGTDAWNHLDSLAGQTMAVFIEKYIRGPMSHLLKDLPDKLPSLTLTQTEGTILISIGGETLTVVRREGEAVEMTKDGVPPDLLDGLVGT